MSKRNVQRALAILLFLTMVGIAVALWRGVIPIDWLASLGYKGIFVLSFVNGVAPVAGPSQIVTFFAARKLNPLGVGLAAGIGGAIGELATYAFGYSFREAQSAEAESKIQKLAKSRFLRVSREHSFIPLFALASFPNPLFKPACAVAGSLKIGLKRYFVPILLAKTLRHVVIAYAGFYSISLHLGTILNRTTMAPWLYALLFVVIVVGIALVAWLIRTIFESEPDPFLLNFTFFAFAGQCILTAEVWREGNRDGLMFGLLVPAAISLLLQIFTISKQLDRTREYYKQRLDEHKIADLTPGDIEYWATILVRITGVDFYPEFYERHFKGVGSPREKRRVQAISVLPRDKFNSGTDGLTPHLLKVPPDDRRFLWRCYVAFCISSWLFFIFCILIVRRQS